MAFNLRNRSFLKEIDFTPDELRYPAALAEALKIGEVRGHRGQASRGQGDRADLREDLDPHPLGLRGRGLRPGRARDVPRSRRARSSATRSRSPTPPGSSAACTTPSSSAATRQTDVEELAAHAGVPVYNGLTNEWHPTQMLADFLTMHEASGKPYDALCLRVRRRLPVQHGPLAARHGRADGRRRPARAGPASCTPRTSWTSPTTSPRRTGARITITDDPAEAVDGVDFVHTDVWVSMGEAKDVWTERVELLAPYQVNTELLARPATRGRSSCTACPRSTTPTRSSAARSWRTPA